MDDMGEIGRPIFRDEEIGVDGEEKIEGKKSNTCSECGATFRKPAYLKQHMQSHSLERPYTCPVDDCHSSYRRKDHLTRHILQHQGKLFKCPIETCSHEFSFQGNMKRHVKEFHCEDCPPTNVECRKQYVCREIGCGKVFKFASKLQKHEDSHVKLDSVEAFCCEPVCMKYFANDRCLKAHIQSCHQHITCKICGTKQLKKNFKRHLRKHEARVSLERVKCNYKGCLHTFSNESNLRQHMKAVHFELKPFAVAFLVVA
ncbi:hypothetical protein CIPAW_03G019700 [Carya illinoinensis]|uniref:C2H2-type domain-containing protein n=1 Tax=Carya illinoinensis TaxID=32201 RepID=A0A8T1QYC6_CARIL|nr:hypothetical protein CIPAW_03G019700 [Carya illinoinensis]